MQEQESETKMTDHAGAAILLILLMQLSVASCFCLQGLPTTDRALASTLWSQPPSPIATRGEADDPVLQWQLFKKYHARGSWKGIWTFYDYIGDVLDETVASVDLICSDGDDNNVVTHTHQIVVDAKRSDCATCFDSMQTKQIPVAMYTPETLLAKRIRLAANSLVCGPVLLRSGVMATELVLSQGDGRVRVIFQHAPVWERGIEPGSCPPQGLKLARAMISREVLRDCPPTEETEAAFLASKNAAAGNDLAAAASGNSNPVFFRPVSPFAWHKKWGGTSWTWGPNTGNRGWSIPDNLPEGDDWHGSAPVEVWNLRLPGGIFVQAPRLVTDAEVGLCRLAWLPNDETLLRVEAGVSALQPLFDGEDWTTANMIGFEPPSLVSLRADVLTKLGDLEGEPQFIRKEEELAPNAAKPSDGESSAKSEAAVESNPVNNSPSGASSNTNAGELDSLQAIRDAMQL